MMQSGSWARWLELPCEVAMKAITRLGLALSTAALAFAAAAEDKKGPEKKPAKLLVKLPADARLEVNSLAVGVAGKTEHTYTTPPLAPGQRYDCVVKAIWAPNGWTTITRARKVTARPGETTEVDLRQADPKQPDVYFIRYVATPPSVVEAMLKLAKVGKGDVVYDLGCGDGRIVVTAVARYGAKRGVGIDLDPARVRDSKAAAKSAGVADKVEVRQEDVLKVKDLGRATVVCLYLGEELNEKLRPLLQKSLKPGTRVVSHRFAIGDWKPDETVTVRVGATDRKVYLWTIKEGASREGENNEKK
jgi:uncharacterized protein (TIGR03000 family)